MAEARAKVGIVGCGNISGVYIKRMRIFHNLEVAACADLVLERAHAPGHDRRNGREIVCEKGR